jgi:pimeloyl-ACP methyl ester carboxylesterase
VVRNQLAALNAESDVPIVVAGHSFGGLVMTNAVTDVPNIKALVYVMGLAPDQGETVAFLEQNYTTLPSNQALVPNGPDGRLLLTQPDYLKYFAPDVDHRDAHSLAVTQGPFDGARFNYPSGPPAWKQVKSVYYVVAGNDQMIPPQLEEYLAKRMNAKTTVLVGASHAGLISQAAKVADVILEAASS